MATALDNFKKLVQKDADTAVEYVKVVHVAYLFDKRYQVKAFAFVVLIATLDGDRVLQPQEARNTPRSVKRQNIAYNTRQHLLQLQ